MKRRIPFIEQHQKTECGLCCIAMVSSYFDHEVTLQELRDMKETGRDGATFKQLIDLFELCGKSNILLLLKKSKMIVCIF